MKNFFLRLIIGITVLTGISAGAQTFGGGIPVSGNTNAQMQNSSYVVVSNNVLGSLPQKTLVLSGIFSTNENVWGYYGFRVDPSLYPLAPGTTNVFILTTFTNNFYAGTNSGTWTTNFQAYNVNALVSTIVGLTIGVGSQAGQPTTYTNNAYMACNFRHFHERFDPVDMAILSREARGEAVIETARNQSAKKPTLENP